MSTSYLTFERVRFLAREADLKLELVATCSHNDPTCYESEYRIVDATGRSVFQGNVTRCGDFLRGVHVQSSRID